MHFHKMISIHADSEPSRIISVRTAVRAIIIEEGKILMVRSNRGYFKLPGGGVEADESHAEALAREVTEETGYKHCRIGTEIGTISELRPDKASPRSLFQMDSHHFLCELYTKDQSAQSLVGYEQEEGYSPVWVTIQEAVEANSSAYETDKSHIFIPRENFVLEWLQQSDFFTSIYSGRK